MVSAQDTGLATDDFCRRSMEKDTQLGAGQTAFPSGVEDFNTAVCRHAGSYLQSLEAKLSDIDPDKT